MHAFLGCLIQEWKLRRDHALQTNFGGAAKVAGVLGAIFGNGVQDCNLGLLGGFDGVIENTF